MRVQKRNGKIVQFNKNKIIDAISKAGYVEPDVKNEIASYVESQQEIMEIISVEEIQDLVEKQLMSTHPEVAKEYVRYRYKREMIRETEQVNNSIMEIIASENEYVNGENSNKNPKVLSTQRDYMAGEVSKDISRRLLLPPDIVEAHDAGIIHFHDTDYFAQHMHNCCLVDLEDMLQNGTVISDTLIEKPHSFITACNVATQIMAQVASNQYGGQSESLAHLAPFVDVSRQNIKKDILETIDEIKILKVLSRVFKKTTSKIIDNITEHSVRKEIKHGVQTIQYQINTLMTTNGQTPFVTIWMYLNEVPEGRTRDDLAMIIEEVFKQRRQGVKNEKGVYITPAFPKLVYALTENNINPDSEYYYLTKLAASCTAKRMVPDYVSEKKMLEMKKDANGEGHCYPPMGCRSFLTPYITEDGNPKYFGRFNQGVVTINLVDVALSAIKEAKSRYDVQNLIAFENEILYDKNNGIFWRIFEERLELCHRALQCRHQRLKGTVSDVSPIHWQHGALARLKKGETIDKLLYGGYSTLSLGYAGLYECVKAMTGKSHTDKEAKPFALAIMQRMNDKCAEWREKEDIAYSLYGTPIESTTYKFAKCLRDRFGVIEGITDHDYITNSYHVNVREKIDPFTKLKFESEFQVLSPGGAISYIETADLTQNEEAVMSVLEFIYDNIIYAELNIKSDFCSSCGYEGEISVVEDEDNKLIWKCPNCGCIDQDNLYVARRTCGYIGAHKWNQGRTAEIRDRFVHLGGDFDELHEGKEV